jgi:hypothetical protein
MAAMIARRQHLWLDNLTAAPFSPVLAASAQPISITNL